MKAGDLLVRIDFREYELEVEELEAELAAAEEENQHHLLVAANAVAGRDADMQEAAEREAALAAARGKWFLFVI